MKKIIALSLIFFGLATTGNSQKVSINYSIIDSVVIENSSFTKNEALKYFDSKDLFILDDDDTTRCGGAPTFRKKILYNCRGEFISSHTIYKIKYEVPVAPKGYRSFIACDLIDELLWTYPIIEEVSPDEIVARILFLTSHNEGFLQKNLDHYNGNFIGFSNGYLINIFWWKGTDGTYRWKIQCDNSCGVVPGGEFLFK